MEASQSDVPLSNFESHYRMFFEQSPDGLFIVDADEKCIVEFNDAFLAILGYSREELGRLHLSEFESAGSGQSLYGRIEKGLKTGADSFETKWRRKNGELRDIRLQVCSIESIGDQYLHCIAKDITSRTLEIERLRENERRYRALFDQSSDGVVVVDPKTDRLLEFSDRAPEQLGYTREEFSRLSIKDIEVIESPEEIKERIKRVAAIGSDFFETKHRCKHGEVKDVEVRATRIQVGARTLLQASWIDITQRKNAERLASESESALRRSEAKIRSIVETSTDWIWEMDLTGRHTFSNSRLEAILGYTFKEFQQLSVFDLFHPEDRLEVEELLPQYIASETGWNAWALRFRHKDGSYRYLESNAVPFYDDAGKMVGYRGSDRDITARKQAELEQNDLSRVLEESLNEIYVIDAETLKFVLVNRGARKNLGCTMDDLRQMTPINLKPDFTIDSFSELVEPLRSREKDKIIFEAYHLRKDGSQYDVEVHLQLSSFLGREAFVAIILDITERKAYEKSLEIRERQQAAVAELGQFAIMGGDIKSLLHEIVSTVADTFDVEFCKIQEYIPEKDELCLRTGVGWNEGLAEKYAVERSVDSQAAYTLQANEAVFVENIDQETRFTGSQFIHDHNVISGISVVIHGQGSPFGVLSAHSTNRRVFTQDDAHFLEAIAYLLAETIQRKWAELSIQENEALLSGVINNSASVIYVKDVEGRYMLINSHFEGLFDLKNEEVKGKTDFDLFPKDIARAFRDNDKKVLTERASMQWEEEVPQEDGVHTYLSVKFPLLSSSGDVYALCGISTDITERIQMEKMLRRADRLSSTGTLAAGIAHEINNPLCAASTAAEAAMFIKDDPGSKDLLDQAMNTVVHSVGRCNEIIQNMLRFSRNQSSEKSSQDLNEVVKRSCEMIRSYGVDNNVHFVLELEDKLPQPIINSVEIEQVLINLLHNSIQATEGDAEIIVATNVEESTVSFSVHDKGRGLAEEEQAQVFDPFFSSRLTETGMGLGLSIAHRIIQDHGGTIDLNSQVGVGTSMVVRLPVVANSETRDAA